MKTLLAAGLLIVCLQPPLSAASESAPAADDSLPTGAIRRLGLSRFAVGDDVYSIAFSPNGSFVAVATNYAPGATEVTFFNSDTGVRVGRWITKGMHQLTFTSNGKRIWYGNEVCDFATKQSVQNTALQGALAIAPDEEWALVQAETAKPLALWNPGKSEQIAALDAAPRSSPTHGISMAIGGAEFAFITKEGAIAIYEAPRGQLRQKLDRPTDRVATAIAFSARGDVLAVGDSRGGVRLVEADTGKTRITCKSQPQLNSAAVLAIAPDGKYVVAAAETLGKVFVWDGATGEPIEGLTMDGLRGIRVLKFSPDGRILAVGGAGGMGVTGVGLRMVDWNTRQEWHSSGTPRSRIKRLDYSPNGQLIAASTVGNEVDVWDSATGKLLYKLRGDCSQQLAFSRDGWILGGVGAGGSYHLWSADSGDELVHRPAPATPQGVTRLSCFAISPDLSEVALGDTDGRVRLVATATGADRSEFAAYEHDVVGAIAFLPDGKSLATTRLVRPTQPPLFVGRQPNPGPNAVQKPRVNAGPPAEPESIQIWDAATGKIIKQPHSKLIGDRNPTNWPTFDNLEFSPDGATVLARHTSNQIVLLDVSNERQIGQFTAANCAALSPDSSECLVAGGSEVQAIEVATGAARFTRRIVPVPTDSDAARFQRADAVVAVAFAPDGRTFATAGSYDNTVLIWPVSPPDWKPLDSAHTLGSAELDAAWGTLAEFDAAAAYTASWRLIAAGNQTVAFIRENFAPAGSDAAELKQIDKWIEGLDSDQFAVREQATGELKSQGGLAEPQLRMALKDTQSPEVRTRVEHVLAELNSPTLRLGGKPLRRKRAIEILERIGTHDAKELLQSLSSGAAIAPATRNAKAALDRLRALRAGP